MRLTDSGRFAASVPDGLRVYAVGDIHGRLDLLEIMLDLVDADQRERGMLPALIVFLGDYVDRGPSSKEVVDAMLGDLGADLSPVFVKGNHEALLMSFLYDATPDNFWLKNGGDAALLSYGIDPDLVKFATLGTPTGLQEASLRFREALPASHLRFYRNLKPCFRVGGYFFVHGGVRPGVPLDMQREEDMLWIRDPFLTSDADFGAVVVHGHTPAREPQLLPNRIGVDTYAFKSNRLTAVGLEGTERWILSTAS
ncbi:metallophosphoesterase family protein [Rhodomicrobium sp.]|uniref:metallophosphoesterase family protein n=1 Tax=Rhodomicrobium sp. TaxID=2720632 RepID=UPI0039E41BF2